MKSLLSGALVALVLVITFGLTACGSSGSQPFAQATGGDDGGGVVGDSGAGGFLPDADATVPPVLLPPPGMGDGAIGGDGSQLLTISPSTVTLAVVLGTTPSIPTQQFTATYAGVPIAAQFTVDKGQIGTIGVATGLFTPGSL